MLSQESGQTSREWQLRTGQLMNSELFLGVPPLIVLQKMKKSILILVAGLLIGFLTGRIIPPSKPTSWNQIERGMHYSEVYNVIPSLREGMRDVKGVDTCIAEFGSSYWQLFVYYDDNGKVYRIETKLF